MTIDYDNCSTQRMLRNLITCVIGIRIIKAIIIITSLQSASHNFIVVHQSMTCQCHVQELLR